MAVVTAFNFSLPTSWTEGSKHLRCLFWSSRHFVVTSNVTYLFNMQQIRSEKCTFRVQKQKLCHLSSELVLILRCSHRTCAWVTFLNISFSKQLIFTDEVCSGAECFPWHHFQPLIHSRARSMLHMTMIMIPSDDSEPWSSWFW